MTSEFNVAVHALVYLSHRGGTLSSEELAQNICTNAARVPKRCSPSSKRRAWWRQRRGPTAATSLTGTRAR